MNLVVQPAINTVGELGLLSILFANLSIVSSVSFFVLKYKYTAKLVPPTRVTSPTTSPQKE